MTKLKKLTKENAKRNAVEQPKSTYQLSEEQTKKFREYQKSYIDVTYRQYCLRFRGDTDADIIAYLDDPEKVPNLTGMVRRMILEKIYEDDPREKDPNGRPYEVVKEFEKDRHEKSLLTKEQIGRGI